MSSRPFASSNSVLSLPLAVAAAVVGFPFLFGFTQPPMSNFWPLVASGACGLVLVSCVAWRWRQPMAASAVWRVPGDWLAWGLAVGGVLGAGVGLTQFFFGDVGAAPWIFATEPGWALGNLRQRNQQSLFLALGIWGVLWLVAQRQEWLSGKPYVKFLGMAAVALMAISNAATTSRAGALALLLVLGMCWMWRASLGRLWSFAACAGLAYAFGAWALPALLDLTAGVAIPGVLTRFADPQDTCPHRPALWSSMLHLISLKPWSGWGWEELAYAHYVTLFPGVRFCGLLDNAHNLPLHLAVELGLPFAMLVSIGAVVLVVRARPWAEMLPHRQMAWGVLVLVGMHSMLEYPLWYGPFQLVSLAAIALLCSDALVSELGSRKRIAGGLGIAIGLAVVMGAFVIQDYRRVAQLYLPEAQRMPAYQTNTQRKVLADTWLFREAVYFAVTTTTPVTADNAAYIYQHAREVLHYSPEPRVIEAVLESAQQLHLTEEVAFHRQRYRLAYPQDYARWERQMQSGRPTR